MTNQTPSMPFDLQPLHDSLVGMMADLDGVDTSQLSKDELYPRLLSTLDRADAAIGVAQRFRLRIKACLRQYQELDGGTVTAGDALTHAGIDISAGLSKEACLQTIHESNTKLRDMGVSPAFLLCVDTVIYDTARLALERDSAFFEAFNNTMSTKAGAMHALLDMEGKDREQGAAHGIRYEDDPGPPCRTLSEVQVPLSDE
jgi:hypothetical protein